METVTQIHVAWELQKAGHKADEIAAQLGKHRATIYRWPHGIRQRGIRGYVRYFKQCKRGHGQRVLSLRRAYRNCCGEKLVYLLSLEGIKLSLSTVYRILKRHLVLRKKRSSFKGEPVQQATYPRHVSRLKPSMARCGGKSLDIPPSGSRV